MQISYGILSHNEESSLYDLLERIYEYREDGDEIVIVDDFSTHTKTKKILAQFDSLPNVRIFKHALDNDYASQKNFLGEQVDHDWIVNLDADEQVTPFFIQNIKSIIQMNPEVELYGISRINRVEGLTPEHITKWKWHVNEQGGINFPDVQGRVYRSYLKWEGRVHEKVVGYECHSALPQDEEYCIIHNKTITRQEAQNTKYDTIER